MGGDTCIVDHDVHSAPFMDQAVFELLQVSDLGDITVLVKRLDAQILQFGQRLLAPLVVDIGNGDFPAGPGETQSESLAEAAGAPGNGNALVGKTFHGEFLLFLFYSPLPTGERGWGRGPGVHMQDRTLRAVRALAPSPCVPLPRGRGSCPSLDRDLRAARALAPSPCVPLPRGRGSCPGPDRDLRAARALAPSPCVPLPRGRGSCPSLDRDLRVVRTLAPSPCIPLPRREREITVSPSSTSRTSSAPTWRSGRDALHRGRPPCAV